MEQGQNIAVKTSLNLTMSPRMQEAINILQMSSCDLSAYIQNQIDQNPLLEENEPVITNFKTDTTLYSTQPQENKNYDIFNTIQEEETLKSYIQKQIFPKLIKNEDRYIADLLIDSLNENGYLKQDIKILAQDHNIAVKKIERVLIQLKKCDPIGIFSSTLQECLKTQLIQEGKLDKKIELFIDHIHLLPQLGLLNICKKTQLMEEECLSFLAEIKKLHPNPAINFSSIIKSTFIYELILFKEENDELLVMLNPDALPQFFLNTDYYHDLLNKTKKREELTYIKERKKQGEWLIQAVLQRSTNLLKIAQFIIEYQKDFFINGINALKPLTLKEVSLKTGLHESTISRLTTEKYIFTHSGTFDLKFFFSSKLNSSNRFQKNKETIEISSKKVMQNIKKLIEQEEKKQPLSDEDLAILLKNEGIDIARRTVAKYRIQLGIENSSARRQMF